MLENAPPKAPLMPEKSESDSLSPFFVPSLERIKPPKELSLEDESPATDFYYQYTNQLVIPYTSTYSHFTDIFGQILERL